VANFPIFQSINMTFGTTLETLYEKQNPMF
jgi:hypothetical protein